MKRLACVAALAVLWLTLPFQASAEELLIPVGTIVGLQLKTDSVTVAAFDDVLGKNARDAGLKIGDEILQINGEKVKDIDQIRSALTGEPVSITVRRGSRESTLNVTPKMTEDGPRLGIYLRQGITGIGTVTWYDPDTNRFGALGHGVNTSKGDPLRMTGGSAFNAEILSVKKGKCGEPGQLKGSAAPELSCGTLTRNTPQGLFGTARQSWKGEPIPAARWEELSTGPAVIRSTVSGTTPREYSVEIVKVYPNDRPDGRNLLLKVTDPDLLSTTGGIVQGMSGSPIIQNGRLIGAVTHVLVSDPTMGYGIFIQNMLDAAA